MNNLKEMISDTEDSRLQQVKRLRHFATKKLVMLRAMADYEESVIRWCDNEMA